jgi:hypothetical protein
MSDRGLIPEQRAELERMGPEPVSLKLATYQGGHTGPESTIGGFLCGDIRRRPIDHWLDKKLAETRAQERIERLWTRITTYAAIIGAAVAVVGVVIQIMTTH